MPQGERKAVEDRVCQDFVGRLARARQLSLSRVFSHYHFACIFKERLALGYGINTIWRSWHKQPLHDAWFSYGLEVLAFFRRGGSQSFVSAIHDAALRAAATTPSACSDILGDVEFVHSQIAEVVHTQVPGVLRK